MHACSPRAASGGSWRRRRPPSSRSTSTSPSKACASFICATERTTEDRMPADDPAKIRNVAVIGQGGVGKTLTADAMLFAAGATTRIGRTEDGSSAFDSEPEEQRRRSSITAALQPWAWKEIALNMIEQRGDCS